MKTIKILAVTALVLLVAAAMILIVVISLRNLEESEISPKDYTVVMLWAEYDGEVECMLRVAQRDHKVSRAEYRTMLRVMQKRADYGEIRSEIRGILPMK
jgi:hypothetical protein